MDQPVPPIRNLPAPKIPWDKIVCDERTGAYLNPTTHQYEYRGFFDSTFVIVGICPQIMEYADPDQLDAWETKCRAYMLELLRAH